MSTLFHIVFALSTAVAAVSVAATLPFLRPDMEVEVAWLAGGTILLTGLVLHEMVIRRERARVDGRRLDALERAVEDLSRRMALIGDAAREGTGDGGANYEAVIQEVKLLQSLVSRLTDKRRPAEAPRPPASAPRRPLESGVPVMGAPTHAAFQSPPGGAAAVDKVFGTEAFADEAARNGEPRNGEPRYEDPREDEAGAAQGGPERTPPAAPLTATPMSSPMNDASVLEAVHDALKADRIDIYLQPIVSLPQRKHRFYEVFSRVRGADGSLIMPDRYLDVAEREGLIATIDNLLLVRCIQLIRETERRQHAIGFFSNISAATLSDADFMKHFLQLMAQNQALVPKLVFELSQEQLRAGGAVTMGILSQLARIGFRFSMDQVTDLDIDLETLLAHEFRCIKLDHALLLDPAQAPRVADLRRRIAGEPIDIIVEKIETEEELERILEAGIDFGQGYLFGEPRPARKPA